MTREFHSTAASTEPRSALIVRSTQRAIRSTGLTMLVFAERVAEEYTTRVAAHERIVEFHRGAQTIDAAAREQRANAQLVKRFLSGSVKFPCDLEEAWVAAIPQPHRAELVRELAARYGLLPARMPAADGNIAQQVAGFAGLAREFADAMQSLAPIFADGRCGPDDRPHAFRAVKAIEDLITEAVTVRTQVRAGCGLSHGTGLKAEE